jgi:hypothetical protein
MTQLDCSLKAWALLAQDLGRLDSVPVWEIREEVVEQMVSSGESLGRSEEEGDSFSNRRLHRFDRLVVSRIVLQA